MLGHYALSEAALSDLDSVTYAEAMAGGVAFGGSAAVAGVYAQAMAGGAGFGGAAAVAGVYAATTAGALVFGGAAAVAGTYRHTMAGGVAFGGAARVSPPAGNNSLALDAGTDFSTSTLTIGAGFTL